jgi:hypothetical protein
MNDMPFDIKRLSDFEPSEEEFYDYQDELLNLFADSPEGKARAEVDDGMAFWARSVIDYGYNYVGVALHEMDANDMEELLTEVFPRKISLAAPDDADEGLPAMIAFWEYLKREYQLSNKARRSWKSCPGRRCMTARSSSPTTIRKR